MEQQEIGDGEEMHEALGNFERGGEFKASVMVRRSSAHLSPGVRGPSALNLDPESQAEQVLLQFDNC